MARTITPTHHLRNFDTTTCTWSVTAVPTGEARTLEPVTGTWYVNPETGMHARLVYDAQADVIMCETWAPFYPDAAPFPSAQGNIGRTRGAKGKAVRAVRAHLARTDWDA